MTAQTDSNVPQIRFKGFEDGWLEDQLEERVEFFSGLTYSPRNVQKGVGTLVLRSSNVKNGEIVNADNVYVDPKIVNSKNVEVGDIAVVVRNGSRSLIGKHAQIKNRMDNTVIGAFMTGIHSDNPAFTNALLDTPQFDKEIAKNLGATINQITTGAFRQMMFRFPKRTEQTQIGEYFRELDRLIGLHQRKHDKLLTLKKAMLQKMFPQPGATIPEIRFKGFSGDWEEKRLGDISSLQTGHPFEGKKFVDKGILLVRGMNVKRGYLDSSKEISEYWPSIEGFENFLLEEDDIVIQMDGALIGKSYAKIEKENLPALLVQRVTRVKCVIVNCDFIYTFIQKGFLGYIRANKTETAVPHLSLHDIRDFFVALPSEAEQQKIGTYFRQLDKLISQHAIQLQKLQQLKSACLEKMFV